MPRSYDEWARGHLSRWCSFQRDSFWSWVLVSVAFLNKFFNRGILFALGIFFDTWKNEFRHDNDDFDCLVNAGGRLNVSLHSNGGGLNASLHSNDSLTVSNDSNAFFTPLDSPGSSVSDATLSWIQSCAIGLSYMSSPIANVALDRLPPRVIMILVGVMLCLSFMLAANLGKKQNV